MISLTASPSQTSLILVGRLVMLFTPTPALSHAARMASSAAMPLHCKMMPLRPRYQPRS